MYDEFPRSCAYIDLNAILYNIHNIKANIGNDRKLMVVLKADAYGHGAIRIAKTLEDCQDVYGYATATAEEAFELKDSGIKKPILILNYAFPYSYKEIIEKEIRITVFREDELEELSKVANELGKKAIVHIKLDTGMGRIGIQPNENGLQFVKKCMSFGSIEIEGIFSHFATADEYDKAYTHQQIRLFKNFIEQVENETGYVIPIKHIANSAASIEVTEAGYDMCRAGIIIYGLMPSGEVSKEIIDLKPALSLYSHVIFVKDCPAGTKISYGSTFITKHQTKIATIPLGYADGYPRSLSNKGYVLIHGQKAPILGRICMDQFMVDVTDIVNTKEGDLVTLIGKDGASEIKLDDLSDLSGRFNYEFACCLGNRIRRVY